MMNRVVALFLACCLMVAAFPFSAFAISLSSPSASLYTPSDYDRFYAQDGLVGLYTAYGTNDKGGESSLLWQNGKPSGWADKVGGRTAIITGNFLPLTGTGGGLGISMTAAEWSGSALTSGIDFDNTYGDLADLTFESILAYDTLTGGTASTLHSMYHTVYRLDVFAAMCVFSSDVRHRPYMSNRSWGEFHGRTKEGDVHMANGHFQKPDGTLAGGAYTGNGYAVKTAVICNQTLQKDTTADAVYLNMTIGGTAPSFYTAYGASPNTESVLVTTEGTLSHAHYAAIKGIKTGNKSGAFSLLNGVPGRLYAVRVYDRLLTEDEVAQNHFVDLCAYFDLDISMLDPFLGVPSELSAAFSTYTFESGTAAALQAILDGYAAPVETPSSYLDLYVKDGLVALFDAFSTTTVSLSKLRWYALVPDANGKLTKSTSVYATMTGGYYSSLTNPTGWRTYSGCGLGYTDPQNTASNSLSLPTSLLDRDSFEVETVFHTALRDFPAPVNTVTAFTVTEGEGNHTYALRSSSNWQTSVTIKVELKNTTAQSISFRPVLSCYASSAATELSVFSDFHTITLAAGETRTEEFSGYRYRDLQISLPDGVEVVSVTFPGAGGTAEARADSAFVFGYFYAMVWSNKQASNTWGNGFGATRLYVANQPWHAHEGSYSGDTLHKWTSGSATDFATYDGRLSYMRVQKTVNELTGAFDYRMKHNGASHTISSDPEKALTTPAFTLAGDLPLTLYSVRVYDRLLSAAEQRRNHAVDLLAFSKIDISRYLALSPTDRLLFDDAVAALGFTSAREELSQKIEALLSLLVNESAESYAEALVEFSAIEPLERTPGYRAAFTVTADRVRLLESLGYSLYYGALVDVGTSEEALTVSYRDGKVTADSGALLAVYGGTDASDTYLRTNESEKTFSAAVLYDDPMRYRQATTVRGFAILVSPDGQVTVSYDAAPMPEGAHDLLSLADYFVNRYEGSLTKMRAYIQNEILRAVLSAHGKEARTEAEGDTVLRIYVDPEGNDNGLGTEAAPYATLAKAFDRALEAYSAGVYSVVIHLAEGVHRVTKELHLNGSYLTEDHELFILGEGRDTIVTSTVPVGKVAGGTLSLPEQNGAYPTFRYLYAADEKGHLTPVRLTHTGTREDVRFIETLPYTNAEEEWVYLFMDADLFDGTSSYAGTELHVITEWDFNVFLIERVDYSATHPGGTHTTYSAGEPIPTEMPGGDVPEGKVMVYLDYDQFTKMAIPQNHTMKGKAYWLENSATVFADDRSQEDVYYYDAATGTLYLRDAASDDTLTAGTPLEIPTLERIFCFTDVKNVTLRDFSVTGVDNRILDGTRSYAGGQAGGSSTVELDTGEKTSYGFPDLAAVFGIGMQGFLAKDMYFYGVAGDGIYLRGALSDITVEDCEFAHIGQTGLRLGRNGGYWSNSDQIVDLLIQNNYIHHTGELFVQCCGMLVTQVMEARILGNTVTNTTYTGISIGWRWGESTVRLEEIGQTGKTNLYHVEIAYNYIADFMTCMRDGGGIYTLGGNVENDEHTFLNSLHDNYMVITEDTGNYDNKGSRWFMGYYHDGASSNWYDYGNVLINATTTGIGSLIPYYIQHIDGQNAHNVTLEGNYAIGFTGAQQVYRGYIDPARYIYANDKIFSSVSAMSAQERAAAGAILATAGCSFAPAGDSGHADIAGEALTRYPIFADNNVYLSAFAIPVPRGDANGDGAVDGKDVILLRRFLVGDGAVGPGADANGDGAVDGKDVILLRRFLVGAETLP